MNYFGIDAASNRIHFTMLDKNGKLLLQYKWTTKEKDINDKFYDLMDQFENHVNSGFFDNSYVIIEAPIYIQNFLTSRSIIQVITGIKYILKKRGVIVEEIGNTTWKKGVGLKGNCKKEDIKKKAIQIFGLSDEIDQDFYDSSLIALYGFIIKKGE